MTRQILPYTDDMEIVMFILTVIIGYGIGSWMLLGYITQISKEIRAKSRIINIMHWTVIIIQFSLFVVLLFMLFSNTGKDKIIVFRFKDLFYQFRIIYQSHIHDFNVQDSSKVTYSERLGAIVKKFNKGKKMLRKIISLFN